MNSELCALAEQFKQLELHAAKGGREVRRVLLQDLADQVSQGEATPETMLTTLRSDIEFLLPALPPYAPPMRHISDMLLTLETAVMEGCSVVESLDRLGRPAGLPLDPLETALRMAESLADWLPPSAKVYTHTLSETVLNVLLKLKTMGRIEQVLVTESRPNVDGRVTAQRLSAAGLPTRLTIDAAMLDAVGEADCMLTGAESIDAQGNVIGKIGAYLAAISSRMKKKPVYVIADTSKILPVPVTRLRLTPMAESDLYPEKNGEQWQPFGSFFDCTPGEYFQGYITEKGMITHQEVQGIALGMKFSPWLAAKLTS